VNLPENPLTRSEGHGRHSRLFSIDAQFPKLDVAGSIPVSRFSFQRLTGLPFSEYSKYSVNGMMLRISAFLPNSPRYKQSHLSPRFGEFL
jgi:hypothetical protein